MNGVRREAVSWAALCQSSAESPAPLASVLPIASNSAFIATGFRITSSAPLRIQSARMSIAVSAVTGKGLDQLIKAAFDVREAWSMRVSTGQLNRWFEKAIEANPPPAPGGKRIKLRYITQAKTRPPGFVVFGTRVDQLPESYRRYLVNGIRKELGFGAVPVRLTLRAPKNPFDDK